MAFRLFARRSYTGLTNMVNYCHNVNEYLVIGIL